MTGQLPLDSQGIWDVTVGLPEQMERAAREAAEVEGLPERHAIEHVVVMGMGGSGIAGDIVLAAAAPFMAVPVVVVKGYECPHFVGDGSLVFAISFSGNTEETIEAASEAAIQGARMVCVTSGGELAKLASSWGAPVIGVPDTIPQPRAGIGGDQRHVAVAGQQALGLLQPDLAAADDHAAPALELQAGDVERRLQHVAHAGLVADPAAVLANALFTCIGLGRHGQIQSRAAG